MSDGEVERLERESRRGVRRVRATDSVSTRGRTLSFPPNSLEARRGRRCRRPSQGVGSEG
jgi:hypothetical protein